MKTKEEIEQLAKKQKGCSKEYCDSIDEQYGYLNGYIDGYTQCQQDMAKDIEYWQGEFEHWHKQAMDMSDNYIKLLNKQD